MSPPNERVGFNAAAAPPKAPVVAAPRSLRRSSSAIFDFGDGGTDGSCGL